MKTHYESSFSNSTNVRGLISNDVYSIKDIENRISYTGIRNKLDQYHSYGKYFTINNGQVNSEVEFYIQGKGIWFTSTGVVLELREPIDEQPEHFNKFEMTGFDDNKESINIQYKRKVVTFEFVNCNNINPIGIEELFHKSNFFYGNDSGKWCTDLSNYKSILYRDIYKYIDLIIKI